MKFELSIRKQDKKPLWVFYLVWVIMWLAFLSDKFYEGFYIPIAIIAFFVGILSLSTRKINDKKRKKK